MAAKSALKTVLQEFVKLAEIPRPSHHEEPIGAYLVNWAGVHGLSVTQDELGDVIIEKPASDGCGNSPCVILQAHMDMVCVADEGVRYDPLSDPIQVLNDGATLSAAGTSLGADDGIGVALCLWALQDPTIRHGPLRVIFTVNEEDGMTSANMSEDYLRGDYLINLDWEWLGSLCNSSAGGDFLSFEREIQRQQSDPSARPIRIQLKGLLGGHSGVDINRGRANAIVCVAGALAQLTRQGISFDTADFHGGQARNAIPPFAEATILVAPPQYDAAMNALSHYEKTLKAGFENIETALSFSYQAAPSQPYQVLRKSDAEALIRLIVALPNNVHTMSPFVKQLVESSQNIGLLAMEAQKITLGAMGRSCSLYRGEELSAISQCISELCGFRFAAGEHVPAWALNPNSKLTPIACEEYQRLTGREMIVEPVHGGLECGAFFEKCPGLDMIAIGPSLKDVHTPKETCDIESVAVTADLIEAILGRLI